MRIGRTQPPAAAPIYFSDLVRGIAALFQGHSQVNRFEKELKKVFDRKHCFLLSSGKASLTVILQSLKTLHPDRNEVIIPAYNCYSVPSAIVRSGLSIVLCDMDAHTLDFDYDQLGKLLVSRKRSALAVIPAHLFGVPADIPRLRNLINSPDIAIIEDAAQAMGGVQRGRMLGTLGDAGFFSLGRGKAFSTVEGGIILTDRDDLAGEIKKVLFSVIEYTTNEQLQLIVTALVLSVFQYPSLFWLPKSLPFLRIGDTIYDPDFQIKKYSPFQAGLAWNWREKLADFTTRRAHHTAYWMRSLPGGDPNRFVAEQNLPHLLRFPIFLQNKRQREKILLHGTKEGLGIMFTYPAPLNRIQELEKIFTGQEYPVADQLSRSILTLPVHPLVSEKDRSKINQLLHGTLLDSDREA